MFWLKPHHLIRFAIFVYWVFFLSSCVHSFPLVGSPQPTSHIYEHFIYVYNTWPSDNSIIPDTLFRSESGFNNMIIIEWSGQGLVETGEHLDGDMAVSRTLLTIDGNRALFISGLDQIVLSGDAQTSFSGPYIFCWKANLQPGVHEAILHFNKSSGDVATYSWHFTIEENIKWQPKPNQVNDKSPHMQWACEP